MKKAPVISKRIVIFSSSGALKAIKFLMQLSDIWNSHRVILVTHTSCQKTNLILWFKQIDGSRRHNYYLLWFTQEAIKRNNIPFPGNNGTIQLEWVVKYFIGIFFET